MADNANPFEAMMKMGQDWAKALGVEAMTPDALARMWPTMAPGALEATMGKTFNPEGLDARTRLLLTLMGLTIQGALAEAQITLTVRNAAVAGATRQEIAETIAMAALFGGAPGMQKAMTLATEALTEDDT